MLIFARAPTSLPRVGSAKSIQPYACALRVEIAVHPSVGHSAMRWVVAEVLLGVKEKVEGAARARTEADLKKAATLCHAQAPSPYTTSADFYAGPHAPSSQLRPQRACSKKPTLSANLLYMVYLIIATKYYILV